MTGERPVNPRLNEDLRFEAKHGGPPRYQSTTDKPVRYVTVVDAVGAVLGHAWANDEDDAAGWVTKTAGGPRAFNESVLWSTRLCEAKGNGLRPRQVLAELIRVGGAGGFGRVLPDSFTSASNSAAVKALAQES